MLDLWRDGSGLTWRKLGVLIGQLPPESATATARRLARPEDAEVGGHEPDEMPWSQSDMLLAAIYDSLRRLEHYYISVNSKSPPRAPEPLPRPGVKPRGRKAMTVGQYRRLTGQNPPEKLIGRRRAGN